MILAETVLSRCVMILLFNEIPPRTITLNKKRIVKFVSINQNNFPFIKNF